MKVIKKQGFDPGIVQMPPHGLLNFRQVLLVHDFVAFQVKRPVPDAVEQGDRLLLPINETLHFQIIPDPLVPLRVDDPDFGIADLQDFPLGVVVARSQRDNVLINDRQDGPDRLCEGVTQLVCVPQKGEPADFHRATLERGSSKIKAMAN